MRLGEVEMGKMLSGPSQPAPRVCSCGFQLANGAYLGEMDKEGRKALRAG